MTWFGIVLVCYFIFGACSSFYYAGPGGTDLTTTNCVVGALISLALLAGLILVGV